MTGPLPRVLPAGPGAGPAALAGELLGRVRAELPAVGGLGEREQVLVAAWLTGLRSARTRHAYAADVAAWLGWLTGRDTGVLAAGRVHVDLWAATQLDAGAAASSVRCRLPAMSSFYRVLRGPRPDRPGPHRGRGPARGGPGATPPRWAWTRTRPGPRPPLPPTRLDPLANRRHPPNLASSVQETGRRSGAGGSIVTGIPLAEDLYRSSSGPDQGGHNGPQFGWLLAAAAWFTRGASLGGCA